MHCGVDAAAVVGDEGVLVFCSSKGASDRLYQGFPQENPRQWLRSRKN
jgi:hypothetical protein